MILLTVIVPVYKVQEYLNECLDSIISQSYQNLEIIIVDDGSPDVCPAICDDYAKRDNRIKVIHQSNQGLSQARNAGVKVATGDYLLFVDSDDKLSDDRAIERLVEFLNKNDATVVYCSGARNLDWHKIEQKLNSKQLFEELDYLLDPNQLLFFVRKNNFFMAAWSFVIRRNFFIENSLFFYPDIYFEDLEWFSRLLFAQPNFKVNVFNQLYYLYRDNPSSITHNFAQPHFESFIKILDINKRKMLAQPSNLFIKDMFNTTFYTMFTFFEPYCLTNSDFYKSNLPTIKSLFRQNYKLLTLRNKILYLFILFSPKAFFVLRKWIKKARRD